MKPTTHTPRTDKAAFRTGFFHQHEYVNADFARQLEIELDRATIGRCRCSDCDKEVNNAWRDSDGHHCLTCLAAQRDECRDLLSDSHD